MTASMLYVRKIDGVPVGALRPMCDIALGNALFFDPDPTCLIQLRPALTSDHPVYGGRAAIGLLLARSGEPGVPDIASYVRVPKRLRKNDRTSILYAISCVERFDASCAVRLREIAARTRWPQPEAQSWTR